MADDTVPRILHVNVWSGVPKIPRGNPAKEHAYTMKTRCVTFYNIGRDQRKQFLVPARGGPRSPAGPPCQNQRERPGRWQAAQDKPRQGAPLLQKRVRPGPHGWDGKRQVLASDGKLQAFLRTLSTHKKNAENINVNDSKSSAEAG